MTPAFGQFLIVAALLAAVWWLVAGRHIWHAESDRIDDAIANVANETHQHSAYCSCWEPTPRACPYLDCTHPADDWIYDRAMCSGHAEAIRGRSDR